MPETKFDLKDDLGVGDESIPSGEGFLRFGRLHIRAAYTRVCYDGNRTLTREIDFNGMIFPVSEDVISRLDVEMLDAEAQFDILRPELIAASFHVGLIGKVKFVAVELELTGASAAEKEDFRIPVPMVGLAAGSVFLNDVLRIDARVTGVAYSGNHLYEADAFASFVPVPFFRVQGGYRLIDLKTDENDLLADIRLSGPYLGMQLSY